MEQSIAGVADCDQAGWPTDGRLQSDLFSVPHPCDKNAKNLEVLALFSQRLLFDPTTDRRSAVRLARVHGDERKKTRKKAVGEKTQRRADRHFNSVEEQTYSQT